VLTREQNDTLTQAASGTPMGQLFRRYWIPALLSEELPGPDCPPVRVKLLSERLIAFRDTQGRVGLLDEFCAHRRSSLWFARNEENGLRCAYHGWKYDVHGNCLEVPQERGTGFEQRVKLTAYPTLEQGGVIWAYMGPPERKPAPPDFEWMRAPETHRNVTKNYQANNFLQSLEGGLDTSHSSFLHNESIGDNRSVRNIDSPVASQCL